MLVVASISPAAGASQKPVSAAADGAGFEWLLTFAGKGTQVSIMRGKEHKLIYIARGECSVENQFDVPAHPSSALITPLVSCKAGAQQDYIVAQRKGRNKGIVFTHYSAAASCTDFTACRVEAIKRLLKI